MATPVSGTARQKPSFASIAAMAPPGGRNSDVAALKNGRQKTTTSSLLAKSTVVTTSPSHTMDPALQDSLAHMNIKSEKTALKTTGIPEFTSALRHGIRFEDEQTHLSTSSTKQASLDGKSTASGTTFAMDEKESLRPDDSASVKAADEEDSCSGPGSGAPSSHMGSEAGGRAFRDQFYEISERIGRAPDRTTTTDHQGISDIEEEVVQGVPPPLQQSLQEAVAAAGSGVLPVNGSVFHVNYRDPDEKLLEALESPKDRLFVLRLEHDVINFIQDSTDLTLDLRTPNSFCRLLAHKLADYYAMTHHADGAQNIVKLYRTPRTPLSAYAQANSNADVSASSQPAVKIMRRAGLIKNGVRADSGPNTTDSSVAPSKAGSENGEDSGRGTGLVSPTESDLSKDKVTMTREEREAKYKEARDRIFNENNDSSIVNEAAQGISRTSSANGRRKSRKQRNNDDGFEARSHFTPYYPALQYPGPAYDQTPASTAYFNPCVTQQYSNLGEPSPAHAAMYSSEYGSNYHSTPSTPGYSVPMQQYPMANIPPMNGFSNMQSFSGFMHPVPQQYYQQPQSSPVMGQHSPVLSSPATNNNAQLSRPQSQTADQQWSQMVYHYPYQYPGSQQQFPPSQHQMPDPSSSQQAIPYQYGQLPYQPHLSGSRSAHPLPGSYNRQQTFNPQTRSFVPGAHSQPSPNGNTLQDPSSSNRFPGTPTSTSGPPYTVSHATTRLPSTLQFGSFGPASESRPQPSRKTQSKSDENQPPTRSTLAKWGTPANLPPKPPPPDPPSMPEGRLSLPQNVPSQTNILLLTNAQSMPTFQNGIYTLPGHGQR
ncbi:MAG: hypothetical protein Q9209_000165 [Squamulea sp. 1 TL-2023]